LARTCLIVKVHQSAFGSGLKSALRQSPRPFLSSITGFNPQRPFVSKRPAPRKSEKRLALVLYPLSYGASIGPGGIRTHDLPVSDRMCVSFSCQSGEHFVAHR